MTSLLSEASTSSRKVRLASLLRSDWLRCALLALVGFAARMPALQGQLIWDDQYLARENPFIKSPLLILEAFRHHLFLDSYSAHYRPVQNISFIFDYMFWNTDAWGFHLTNVFLHVASGLLLYFLLRKLFRPLWETRPGGVSTSSLAAFLIAFLWLMHPIHSAAVDYISGRADSLAFLFASGGWLLHLGARDVARKSIRYPANIAAAFCGLLALCSRETALIWVLLFVVHLLFFDKRRTATIKWCSLGCCVALVAVYSALRHLPTEREMPTPSTGWSPPMKAVLMLRSLGDYGRLMLFPANLHMERTVVFPANYLSQASWRSSANAEYLSIAGLIVLVAMVYGASRRGNAQPLRLFGASWFFIGYLPISNIIELNATVAEHWLYLPSVGFLIFLAGCVLDLPLRYRKISGAIAGVAIVALSVRSAIRSSDWVTPETFYRRTAAAGGMTTRVGVNLGQIYSFEGRNAEAEKIFRKVLAMMPDYPIAQTNLAEILYREGKKEEAEKAFANATKTAAEARKDYPRTWMAVLNMARVRHEQKDDTAALALLDKARADYPQSWEIISFESEVLRQTKGPVPALRLVEKFAQENWWHYGAAIALGRLYAEEGDVARADAALRHASRLDVHDIEALNLLAAINVRQQRFEEAYKVQRRAVNRQPDYPQQYLLLATILEKRGREKEALATSAEATRLKHLALANALPK